MAEQPRAPERERAPERQHGQARGDEPAGPGRAPSRSGQRGGRPAAQYGPRDARERADRQRQGEQRDAPDQQGQGGLLRASQQQEQAHDHDQAAPHAAASRPPGAALLAVRRRRPPQPHRRAEHQQCDKHTDDARQERQERLDRLDGAGECTGDRGQQRRHADPPACGQHLPRPQRRAARACGGNAILGRTSPAPAPPRATGHPSSPNVPVVGRYRAALLLQAGRQMGWLGSLPSSLAVPMARVNEFEGTNTTVLCSHAAHA
jgi:hypothetical protein